MWTSLREKNSRGAVLEGTPHLCEFCLQEPYQILTVKIRENTLAAPPHTSVRGRGKGTI